GEMRANAWLLRPALDLLNILLIVAVIARSRRCSRLRPAVRGRPAVRVHHLHRARGRAADPDHDAVLAAAAGR
ncbi:MAG: hypothetical protein MZW92_80775, partial [Comamonadaceae bacterium]|nr:hypothetical protein [Comamonadaceae bacterium]